MTDQTFYIFSAILLGVVIGALIMYFVSGNKNSDPKAAIAEVENKLNDYQKNVSEHFEQTADLIDELTSSYKKVFDHMSQSARELMTEEQIKAQIEKRKGNKVTLAFLSDEEQSEEKEELATLDNQLEDNDHELSDSADKNQEITDDSEEVVKVDDVETESPEQVMESESLEVAHESENLHEPEAHSTNDDEAQNADKIS